MKKNNVTFRSSRPCGGEQTIRYAFPVLCSGHNPAIRRKGT